MSALAVILVLLGWYIPVVGALITLIAPLPFLVVSAKYGLRYGAITVVVSALISYFFTGDPLIIVSVVLSLGSIGLALGYAVAHHFTAERTLILGAAVFVVVSAIMLYGSQLLLHQNLLKDFADMLRQSADIIARQFGSVSTATGTITSSTATAVTASGAMTSTASAVGTATPAWQTIVDSYKSYADQLESGMLTPALILVGSIALSFYNYVILKPFAGRLGVSLPNMPTMQEIRLPALGVWLLPIAMLLMVIKSNYTAYMGLNLYIIGLYYLIFCGLFYLARILLKDKDNKLIKTLFIVGLIFPYVPEIYFLFGIYDCMMRLIRREG